MSKNAQRRDRQARKKAEKRRREKLREKKKSVQSLSNRLEVRMANLVPYAWDGELVQDVAILDDATLAKLPEDEAATARLVREALAEVTERRHERAVELLNSIPRRSPFSEWRMFVRGFVSWHLGKLDESTEAWGRLDRTRRPWRMAASLMLAHRSDLTEIKLARQIPDASNINSSNTDPWVAAADDALLSHAKLVRQIQVDRVAVRGARGILKVVSEIEDATVEPAHIQWMREFTKDYRAVEPELVQAMHEAIIARAFDGPYLDMFQMCVSLFRGPRHDRNNVLRKYFWELRSQSGKPETYLKEYLQVQLPQNKELPQPLRGAIASELHCVQGVIASEESNTGFMGFPFGRSKSVEDVDAIAKHYEAALKAYPGNYNAYKLYEDLYIELLEEDLLAEPRRKIEAKLADVRRRHVAAIPNSVETRLQLVDYLLENDLSEEAQSHVKVLAGTRTDNPLADAMSWKWNVLESMRQCRRKTGIEKAREHLRIAEQEWPIWLPKTWLPYMQAAIEYRSGKAEAFDSIPEAQRSPWKAADACMRLGAAQRYFVGAAELKPLRQAVDGFVSDLNQIELQDLIALANFFWDVTRTGLRYPAMKMHMGKFLNRLLECIGDSRAVMSPLDQKETRNALLIIGHEGLLVQNYSFRLPERLTLVEDHPVILAMSLASLLSGRRVFAKIKLGSFAEKLKTLAAQEPDIYDRWLFNDLIRKADEATQKKQSSFGDFGRAFAKIMASMQGMNEPDDGSDDDDEEMLCDCEGCRRKRGEI